LAVTDAIIEAGERDEAEEMAVQASGSERFVGRR
jgi:hypothetical protein